MALDAGQVRAARRTGRPAAIAIAAIGVAYVAVTIPGLLSLADPSDPIGDPWFTAMELLILLMAPILPVLWAAIHVQAPPAARVLTLAALVFSGLTAALTSTVHLLILMLAPGGDGSDALGFRWPSFAYVLDILAWDLFFGLAALLAAAAFDRRGIDRAIRALMVASGLLSLIGLLGPVTGVMSIRLIGVFGYAVVFPVAAGLMAVRFGRAGDPAAP